MRDHSTNHGLKKCVVFFFFSSHKSSLQWRSSSTMASTFSFLIQWFLYSSLLSLGAKLLMHLQASWMRSSQEEENAKDNTNIPIYISKTVTGPPLATRNVGKSSCFSFLWFYNRGKQGRKRLWIGTGPTNYTTACHCLIFQMFHFFSWSILAIYIFLNIILTDFQFFLLYTYLLVRFS